MRIVAKPYQQYEQIGDAFTRDEKNYINVDTGDSIKEVRLYTIEEYNFLLGMQAKKDELITKRRKVAQSYDEERKINAGFKSGYITAILGDTYADREYFKSLGAKFSNQFKWYFEGSSEPSFLLERNDYGTINGYLTRKIYWEEVSKKIDSGATILKPTNEIEELLEVNVPIKEEYYHQGEIGDVISGFMLVFDVKVVDNEYGRHAMVILQDLNGQFFIQNTSIARMPIVGQTFFIRGKVIDHGVYKGIRQTILGEVETES